MGKPLRLLIVEDSADDALLMALQLQQSGFDPTWERMETGPALSAALSAFAKTVRLEGKSASLGAMMIKATVLGDHDPLSARSDWKRTAGTPSDRPVRRPRRGLRPPSSAPSVTGFGRFRSWTPI